MTEKQLELLIWLAEYTREELTNMSRDAEKQELTDLLDAVELEARRPA